MSYERINIITHPRFRPLRTIYAAAAQIGVIGVGVVVDSTAMQWAGFIVLSLLVVSAVAGQYRRDFDLTIEQARARLDEIEAQETRR
jgi:hypothetical protein